MWSCVLIPQTGMMMVNGWLVWCGEILDPGLGVFVFLGMLGV